MIKIFQYSARRRCPDTYPFAFKWGQYCCATPFEDISSLHVEGCDGSGLSINSICCEKGNHQICPHTEGCFDSKTRGMELYSFFKFFIIFLFIL